MNSLLKEVNTLIDTSPGVSEELDWPKTAEIDFKDYGSRTAAGVALGACGQLVAVRSAREQLTDAGEQFKADGTDPRSNQAIMEAQTRVAKVQGLLAVNKNDGNLNNRLILDRQDASLLIDAMQELPKHVTPEHGDVISYYAAVAPHLIETADLYIDPTGGFRLEI